MKLSSLADVAALPAHRCPGILDATFSRYVHAIRFSSNALMPFDSVSYARYMFENSVSPP